MSPPKKKAKKDPAEKAAKLKEIEEKRLAIEMERKKREQEMADLLAEQERLRQALEADDGSEEEEEEGEVPDTDTGEVVDTDTGELPDTDTGELPDTDSGEVHTDSAVDAKSEAASSAAPSAAEQSTAERSELSSGEIRTTDAESEPVILKQAPVKHKHAPPVISAPKKSEPAPNRNGIAVSDTQYEVYGNKMFGNLYKERETKFFVVKSANIENVELAMEKKMWITSKVNEIRFNEAVAKHTSVLIFFSVQGSGAFQGVARLCGKSDKNLTRLPWSLPSNMPIENMSYQLQIDWISQQEMKFDNFTHLRNTWNRNKLVKVARDGQEISWKSGCSLGMLFPLDGSCDYDELVSKMKKRRSEIGPKQPPTASSRSARRKKHTDRPTRVVARGVNPAGFKPRSGSQNNSRGPPNKRRRFDNHPGSGANSAPLGDQQTVPSGITSLFDL